MKKNEEQIIKFLGGLAGGYIASYFLLNLVKNQNIKPEIKSLGLVGLGVGLPFLIKDKKMMPFVWGAGAGLAVKGSQDFVNLLSYKEMQKQQIPFFQPSNITLAGDEFLSGDGNIKALPEQLSNEDVFYTDKNENLYVVIKAPDTTTLIDANTGNVVAVNTKNAKHFELNEDTKEVKILDQQVELAGDEDKDKENIKNLFEGELSDELYLY